MKIVNLIPTYPENIIRDANTLNKRGDYHGKVFIYGEGS
jgi:hypothetical protein